MTVLTQSARLATSVALETPRLLSPVRAAVIGLERAGIMHAATLATVEGCELVGLCDADPEARRLVRGVGFRVPEFPSIEKLFAKTQPQAVVVTGPGRGAAVRYALEHGAAVLTDRPLAHTSAEGAELVRLAEEHGRPLAVTLPTLFHPVFVHTHALLAAGALGAPRQVRASMYVSRVFSAARQAALAPPGSAGGVLVHMASDLLALLVRTLGIPDAVRATRNALYGPYEDELHAMMTYASGAEIGLDCSWSVPGYPRPATVIELEAEDGRLLASDDALELELNASRPEDARRNVRMGHADLPQLARFDLEGEANYLMDASFLAWVSGGSAPVHRAAATLDSMRVTDAIYRSAQDGGNTVAVGS